jgi:hypothetical protein
MALPQENAKLIRIGRTEGSETGGWSEDYDRPATDPEADDVATGEDQWQGVHGCYWTERRRRVNAGNVSTVILERSVIVDDDHLAHEFTEGDFVTVLHGGVEKSGRVEVVEVRRMPGVAPSVRLTLEDA